MEEGACLDGETIRPLKICQLPWHPIIGAHTIGAKEDAKGANVKKGASRIPNKPDNVTINTQLQYFIEIENDERKRKK